MLLRLGRTSWPSTGMRLIDDDQFRALFDKEGISSKNIRCVEDLARLPLTTKSDLLPSEEDPERSRRLVLAPNKELIGEHWGLRDRLPLLLKALTRGKTAVLEDLRREYYPIFMTFTTGRSAQPVPFLYSRHDLDELGENGIRINAILWASVGASRENPKLPRVRRC